MLNEKFPLITLEGSPKEIGYQHGNLLKERIKKTIKFYHSASGMDEKFLLKVAAHYKERIAKFYPIYSDEIEEIAKGAEVNPLWIYIINARTELMSLIGDGCTSAYFSRTRILGQNWDWAAQLEDLAVILKIKRNDSHEIIQMTEPGMIGKIGFNNKGLGTCLNFLRINKKLTGVPVHVILRLILDSSSIKDAMTKIENHEIGTASNVLMADDNGNFKSLEFARDHFYVLEDKNDIFIHTNHYLGNEALNTDRSQLASSYARYERATKISKEITDFSINDMKKIFLDKENEELPICRKYVQDENMMLGGTVCSIIMDLPKRELHITKGNPNNHDFEQIKL